MPCAEVNDIRMYYEKQVQWELLILLHGATGAIDFRLAGWGHLVSATSKAMESLFPVGSVAIADLV